VIESVFATLKRQMGLKITSPRHSAASSHGSRSDCSPRGRDERFGVHVTPPTTCRPEVRP
jgi:hypothetical protein